MKKLVILFLIFPFALAAQTNEKEKYFHELRGMEDSTGTSHLFYRMYEGCIAEGEICEDVWDNNIYHFDTGVESDSLFIKSYLTIPLSDHVSYFVNTSDISFMENDPDKWLRLQSIHGSFQNSFGSIHSSDGSFFDSGGLFGKTISTFQTDSSKYAVLDLIDPKVTVIIEMFGDTLPSVNYPRSILVKLATQESEYCDHFESFFCTQSDSLRVLEYSFLGINEADNNRTFLQRNDSLFTSVNLGDSVTFLNDDYAWSTFGELRFTSDGSQVLAITENRSLINQDAISFDEYQLLLSNTDGLSWSLAATDTSRFFVSGIEEKETGDFLAAKGNQVYSWNSQGRQFGEAIYTADDPITGLYKKPDSDILYVLTTEELLEVNIQTQTATKLRGLPVANEFEPEVPTQTELYQNRPNPFNPNTSIAYNLKKDSRIRLTVYNALGQQIQVLVADEFRSNGLHQEAFYAGNISSGVYFYQLIVYETGEVISKRMTLIK